MDPPSSPIRERHSNQKKLRILKKFEKSSKSLRNFCKEKKINPSLLSRWKSSIDKLKTNNKNNFKNGCGNQPKYPEIEDTVFSKISEARNFGTPINYAWIRKCSIETYLIQNPNDVDKIPTFSNMWIRKFMSRYDLTIRKASSQRIEKNTDIELILQYQEEINSIIDKYKIESNDIYNMDETAIYFDLSPDYTVDFIGSKRVSIIKNYAAKARCTCVLTIRNNGDILDPIIIFKGENLPKI
jgi:hypothetical protein